MGFLSKLFGGSDNGKSAGAPTDTGTGIGMLRTTRSGGYDKRSVLAAMDALNAEILALSEAVCSKCSGSPYTLPEPADLELTKVSSGGFNEEDTNAYIGELRKKIAELRALL